MGPIEGKDSWTIEEAQKFVKQMRLPFGNRGFLTSIGGSLAIRDLGNDLDLIASQHQGYFHPDRCIKRALELCPGLTAVSSGELRDEMMVYELDYFTEDHPRGQRIELFCFLKSAVALGQVIANDETEQWVRERCAGG